MKHGDAIKTPVLDMLTAAKGRAWLHMPGHGGALPWLDAALDMTELPVTDDLNEPSPGGAFEEAQALMAEAAGAAGCMFLAGGSTLGVQAMLLAFVPIGGKVIMERHAHKSAIAACAIGGLTPIYVSPRWNAALGHVFLNEEDILSAISQNPDAQAVFITRPDYYGICTDIKRIAEACHKAGIALLVDEAHGSHFMYGSLIHSSGKHGADAWTNSAHKTLPALTQSACAFFRDRRNEAALRRVVHILGSSSPSFLLMASMDWARAQMLTHGESWMERAVRENRALRARLSDAGFGDFYAGCAKEGIAVDETRLVIDTSIRGILGYDAQTALAGDGVDIEMADMRRIVCIPPLPGADEALARLEKALMRLPAGKPLIFSERVDSGHLPERACGVREAAFSPQERVSLENAYGRICTEAFGAYPPGIPLAMPGEIINEDIVRTIKEAERAGSRFFGIREGCVCVMEE